MTGRGSFSFENYRPRLRPGRVIPQGKRIIFETTDGGKQIVLPVEMADAILLAGGTYTMREIIEKIFRRKGSVHFKTVFKTIQVLRDRGFLENGDELENFSVLPNEAKWYRRVPVATFELLKSKISTTSRPYAFYALGMLLTILGLWGLADLSWPPATEASLMWRNSHAKGLVFFWLGISALLTLQGLVRMVLLSLLTGNVFGITLRVTPWGAYLTAKDESLYLVTDPFYLSLHHLAVAMSTLAMGLAFRSTPWMGEMAPILTALVVTRFFFDLSPLLNSEFLRCIRSLLALNESDIVAGYIKDSSILSLLSPLSALAQRRRLRQLLTLYSWVWALGLFIGSTYFMDLLRDSLETDWLATSTMWLIPLSGISFTVWRLSQDIHAYLAIPAWRLVVRIVHSLRPWQRRSWSTDRISEIVSVLPLFSALSSVTLKKMVSEAEVMFCRRGSRVITQGEVGRDLFVLLDGGLSVEQVSPSEGRRRLSRLRPTTIFGEIAIIEETERTADVIASEQSIILRIPVELIKVAAADTQHVGEIEAFKSAILVNQFFTSAPMFRDLSQEVVDALVARCSLQHFPDGAVVFHQGGHGQSFYMVVRGSVDVLINDRIIKRIRQGGFFGEISVIADIPRTATMKAHEPLSVLQIAASSFWEILSQNIELAMFIESVGEARLKEDIERHNLDAESQKAG